MAEARIRRNEEWRRALQAGRTVTIAPAAARACETCPWRIANQETPPLDDPKAVSDASYYTAEGRRVMWESWLDGGSVRDGCRLICHRAATPTESRWCAGGDGLQQRLLLRWWRDGQNVLDVGPLSGLEAIYQVLAIVVGVFSGETRFGGEDDVERLGIDFADERLERAELTLDGVQLTLEQVARLAHPCVRDEGVGYPEMMEPLTAGELAWLAALAAGSDWRTGPGRGTVVGMAGLGGDE
jgi:hypothetical protein